ncbi:MAG: signal peptidase II [Saprospiraceae bacterium]|nr:signal peptidase II [Saprospiraceae bacterium]
MLTKKIIRFAAMLAVIFANVGCDQVSKAIVRDQVEYHDHIPVLSEHLIITKVENTGAFLSLGDSMSPMAKSLLLSLLPSLALMLALFWLFRQTDISNATLFGMCCVLGGGIGNLFDRVVYGSVTDFLFIHVGIFRTGIFNFADVSITCGTLLVVLQQVIGKRNL